MRAAVLDVKAILDAALRRGEISPVEALILLEAPDDILPDLFEVADAVNRRITNNIATYIRSRKIHYTNVCRTECRFCSFYVRRGSPDGFVLAPAQIVESIGPASGLRQVEIQGGLHPDLDLDYHLELLRAIRSAHPALHIHGYSPAEIVHIARRARTTPHDVLRRMRQAGLGSLSGDSAVILNDKLRKKIAPNLLRSHEWLDTCRAAHRAGLATTATVLIGHLEDEVLLCEHLEAIKILQKRTGGVASLTIVPFLPERTFLAEHRCVRPISLQQIFRAVAVARLLVGRLLRHIHVEWTKIGLPAAIRALTVGASDLGGLAVDRAEIRGPKAGTRLSLDVGRVRAAIERIGRIPIERAPFTLKTPSRENAIRPAWQQAEEPIFL